MSFLAFSSFQNLHPVDNPMAATDGGVYTIDGKNDDYYFIG
jgi:hypothetical protein